MGKAYFKYILALLLFGSNGIVASYILLNSYEIVLLRTLIGGLFLIAVFAVSRRKFRGLENKRHFGYLIISGIAMGASWMFLYEAYTRIGVGTATLAYYCGPVIVMALAQVLFRERLTGIKLIGFLSVLIGMFLVNYRALLDGGVSWGLLCGILSAVMYAVMVIFNKKAASIKGLENSMCQLAVSFIAVAFFTLIKQGAAFHIPAQSIFAILLLGVVNTGIGCYLYFSSIPQLPAQSVAICGYLEPASALIFSVILLNERLTFIQLIGTVMIIGGAAFGEYLSNRRSSYVNAAARQDKAASMCTKKSG